jgi:hypothetical protein
MAGLREETVILKRDLHDGKIRKIGKFGNPVDE